ncbi:DUF2254 domain-containing protein [Microbacterium invictum]|uniref:DUF2254 domain-containing protein n=1 Tax=Microbacterium invictum TaxID=515415 RepID=A0ABZ0VAY0_9MICO|nr:DUF2254 domain-containing protein [Microbacterium invictum]WQB70634.1 DUF2254 domain-containing protein [Microbacterium invictum]
MTTVAGNGPGLRVAAINEAIASRLWPIPLAATVVAVALGVLVPEVDRVVDQDLSPTFAALLFGGGVEAARAVLSAIAGSVITVTSLTFSLTVLALQLASSQGSPRLLRMFAADRMVHATLATFMGTFAYALTVLRTVEDATEGADAFVPRIAVTVASVATLTSVVMLTFFLAHLARQLRLETMMRDAHREASRTIDLLWRARPRAPASIPPTPRASRDVAATTSGFLTGVDRAGLIALAREHDIVVEELCTIGDSIVAGSPVLRWWHRDTALTRADAGVDEWLLGRMSLSYEPTPSQDVSFGIRQIADVAMKALSPGVNDPTTAEYAVGHLADLLADIASRPDLPACWADEAGTVRLIPRNPDFRALVDLGLGGVRRYGSGDPRVAARLIRAIGEIGRRTQGVRQREALFEELAGIERAIERLGVDDGDLRKCRDLIREVTVSLRDA